MKQGKGHSASGATKVEPISKAKNLAKAANQGIQQVRTREYADHGRGFTAPAPTADTRHKSGSQGKH